MTTKRTSQPQVDENAVMDAVQAVAETPEMLKASLVKYMRKHYYLSLVDAAAAITEAEKRGLIKRNFNHDSATNYHAAKFGTFRVVKYYDGPTAQQFDLHQKLVHSRDQLSTRNRTVMNLRTDLSILDSLYIDDTIEKYGQRVTVTLKLHPIVLRRLQYLAKYTNSFDSYISRLVHLDALQSIATQLKTWQER